ncbi:MAG: antitoxin family protein [Acidobacteriaceae bacterium]|nr:antitoxin family protein [Acidobacteriaceae bacterium]MBV9765062.1 antitoxin family protein [Acidobacteriaceae bacterium]
MVRQLEAVFEHGVLRPLEPVPLAEKQHVLVTIADMPLAKSRSSREADLEWLKAHGNEYPGEWVALDGGALISHGSNARSVRDEARQRGIARPLLLRIREEQEEHPSAGWL